MKKSKNRAALDLNSALAQPAVRSAADLADDLAALLGKREPSAKAVILVHLDLLESNNSNIREMRVDFFENLQQDF